MGNQDDDGLFDTMAICAVVACVLFALHTAKDRFLDSPKRYTESIDIDEFDEEIKRLSKISVDTVPYFLEAKGKILDEWYSTILIYAYPDNREACETVLAAARAETPGQGFRCRSSQ